MRTILVLFEPFHEVQDVSTVSALPALEQCLAFQHFFAADLADSRTLSHVFPVTDTLLCHVYALQERSCPLRRPSLLLFHGIVVDAPFTALKSLEFSMLSRKLEGLFELDAIISEAGELMSESSDGLQVEVLVEV